MKELASINNWFDKQFKHLEIEYPDIKIIRKSFVDNMPSHILRNDENPKSLLNKEMAIDKIIKFRSLNHDQSGVIALTFSDNREKIMSMYKFSQSGAATMIREELGIKRHWFLVFEGGFETIETNGREPSLKHMLDNLDELWLLGKSCSMMLESPEKSVKIIQDMIFV